MTMHKAAFGLAGLLAVAITGEVGAQADPAEPTDVVVIDTPESAGRTVTEEGTPTLAVDTEATSPVPPDRLGWHIPDPDLHRQGGLERLEQAKKANDTTTVNYLTRVFDRVDAIRRPQQLRLTLEDALCRGLQSSYAIEVQSYNPAVETTRVVEAESAFDAVFFFDITKTKVDQPTASQLMANDFDGFDSTFGIRKLLPTGMQVTGYYGLSREKTSLSFQELNPAYTSEFVLDVRQPLLRNFGIDVNRSIIYIQKNNRQISDLAFRRQIQDTLNQVETSYWRLAQARRTIVITARLLADFEGIYEYLKARQAFDVTPVQLSATKADLELSRVEFVQRRAEVFDAEDRLIATMNDPEINLADNIEIIPVDLPRLTAIVVDRLAEVQTALDQRPEIKEGELRVANAKIAVGQAKNAELPKLDLAFTYNIQGLAGNADKSFDEVSRHKFVTYVVGVQFETPIGNRGPRAAHHRTRLEHAQAEAALKFEIERTILEVNEAARALSTAYEQIPSSLESAEARGRQVESIVARAERKDMNTLSNELGARRSLAEARQIMLAAMVNYNLAIINLEQAKGTLLRYNNVVIPTEDE